MLGFLSVLGTSAVFIKRISVQFSSFIFVQNSEQKTVAYPEAHMELFRVVINTQNNAVFRKSILKMLISVFEDCVVRYRIILESDAMNGTFHFGFCLLLAVQH